jgi:hypothetical protein
MNVCKQCATENVAEARFCCACGAPISTEWKAIERILDDRLPNKIRDALKANFADQKALEIETSELVAERTLKWAKTFGFFVGIPLAIVTILLGFIGIKTWSDIRAAQETITFTSSTLASADAALTQAISQAKSVQAEAQSFHQKYVEATKDLNAIPVLLQRQQQLETDVRNLKHFADQSTAIISSYAAVMDPDAAFAATTPYLRSQAMKTKFPDAWSFGPGTPEFEDTKKLIVPASKVLQQYMKVLGSTLADSVTVTNGNDVSGISASLNRLGITSGRVTRVLDATSQLANLLSPGLGQQNIKDVVEKANPDVQVIIGFFAAFAQQNATLYDKAKIISGVYWQTLVADCESRISRPAVGCSAIIALAINVQIRDEATLSEQIRVADAAAAAFKEIGADHQAITESAGNLNSASLLSILRSGEPVLISAIKNNQVVRGLCPVQVRQQETSPSLSAAPSPTRPAMHWQSV